MPDDILYGRFEAKEAENGWILKYYNSGDTTRVFESLNEMIEFIKERWGNKHGL